MQIFLSLEVVYTVRGLLKVLSAVVILVSVHFTALTPRQSDTFVYWGNGEETEQSNIKENKQIYVFLIEDLFVMSDPAQNGTAAFSHFVDVFQGGRKLAYFSHADHSTFC